MINKKYGKQITMFVFIVFLIAGVVFAQHVFAQGGMGGGGGGGGMGGGGGGEETTLGNNLSVPTIFVNGGTPPVTRIACPSPAVDPGVDGKEASTEYPGYWLQKTEAIWTAECTTAESATVSADWGDNLTGEHGVAGNHTVRVEVGLLDMSAIMTGYTVENLTPTLEDRNSTYGTLGNPDALFTTGTNIFTKVWDPSATLKIEKMDGLNPISVIYDGPISSEINSTGAIVYGYNWGNKGNPPGSGMFRITFTTSEATTIVGVTDTGAEFTEHSTSIFVNLTGSGGGGEGGGENEGSTITNITPTSGPDSGGTLITITGTGFVDGAVVTIGGVNATSTSYVDSTTITAVTPPHTAGVHDVTVTNPDNQSATLVTAFSFVAPPTITNITPTSGPDSGGTLITITGTGFVDGAVVTIGGVNATNTSYVDSTTITAVTPPHTAGVHDVTVTNPDNQSATLVTAFSFVAPPSSNEASSGGGSSGSRHRSSGQTSILPTYGQVLGATIDETSCGTVIESFLRRGVNNNPEEVKKLQSFLNNELGLNIPLTGFFGPITESAVKQFQIKYKDQILAPWVKIGGLPSDTFATGYVFKTTLFVINKMICSTNMMPEPVLF